MCPLKDAARDAPHLPAILWGKKTWSYRELDRYVEQIDPPLIAKASDPLLTIGSLFAAWRKEQSFFPLSPHLPHFPRISQTIPSSLLLYTSGSSADPKIAILKKEALLSNALSTIEPLDLKVGDQWRLSLPLYHVAGIAIVLRCLLARATLVIDDSPDLTHISCIPTHLYRSTPIYPRLRCLLLGGAPLPSSLPSFLPIFTTYGLTEMGSMVTLNGTILENRELRLSKEGEIEVKGPCLFQGYMGEPPQQGWFSTKDLGRIEKGKLIFVGRKDRMFISGGENIQPEEIEQHIKQIPSVIDAVVLPIDDPEYGKKAVAILEAPSSFSQNELQAHLEKVLPKFKIPKYLFFVAEMPRKNNGKIDRFILSQLVNNELVKN